MKSVVYLFSILLVLILRKQKFVLHTIILTGYIFIDFFFEFFSSTIILTWFLFNMNLYKGASVDTLQKRKILGLGSILFLLGYLGMIANNELNYDNIKILSIKFITCVIWVGLFFQTIHGFEQIKKFLIRFCVLKSIEVSFFGIYQYFQQDRILNVGYYAAEATGNYYSRIIAANAYRLTGLITVDPINAGFFLTTIIAILILFNLEKFRLWKVFFIGVNSIALILTWARTPILMFLVSMFFYFYFYTKKKLKYIAIVVVVLIGVFFAFASIVEKRIKSDERLTTNENFDFRIQIYQAILNGTNNLAFITYLSDPYPIIYSITKKEVSTENMFFELIIERGILPFIVFAVLVIYNGRLFIKCIRMTRGKNRNLTFLITVLYVASIIMTCTFNMEYDSQFIWMFFALSGSFIASLKNIENSKLALSQTVDDLNFSINVKYD